jgi:hypothetical protein
MGHKAERNRSMGSGRSRGVVAQRRLDGRVAFAELAAADEKNREGSTVPIRDDLAADLRACLADKRAVLQAEARRVDEPIPSRLPAETRLFVVPKELVRILNRDLKLAGISKEYDPERTIDVHGLRTTFGTLFLLQTLRPR